MQRVICYVSRGVLTYGHLIKEDDATITLKTISEELKTLEKSTIHRIDRLSKSYEHPEIELLLRNGLIRKGRVKSEDWYKVILTTKGAELTFDRTKILRIRPVPSFEEKYDDLSKYVNYNDPGDVILFCNWLSNEKRHDLAIKALKNIPEKKQNRQTRALLKLEEKRLQLQGGKDTPKNVSNEEKASKSSKRKLVNKTPILTQKMINLIRFYELNLDRDENIAIKIEKETAQNLINQNSASSLISQNPIRHKEIKEMSPHQIVRLMIDLRSKNLYEQITVDEDPASIKSFRNNVHNAWLINRCSTRDCHGGSELTPLQFETRQAKSTQTVYKNFLATRRYRNREELPILNLEQPSLSRLLQAGLPQDLAVYPHPPVQKWKPIFKSMADSAFIKSQLWLRGMMRGLEKPYPVLLPVSEEISLGEEVSE